MHDWVELDHGFFEIDFDGESQKDKATVMVCAKGDPLVAEIPYKAKKIKERIHHLHYLIVTDNSGNTIVRHRQEKDIWQSLCDYPCMEMESEKQPSRRSIEDELL